MKILLIDDHAVVRQGLKRSEEHTSELQSPDQHSFPTRRSSDLHNTRSIGLLGMRERAALLDGDIQWHGERGSGTTVTVRIPHPEKPRRKNELIQHENLAHRRPRRRPTGPKEIGRAHV